jgi:plastocyanin
MKAPIAAATACCVLLLIAGCGSSSTSSRQATTSATAATAATAGTTTTKSSSSGNGNGIKVDTTPKFASPSPSAPVRGGVVEIAYRDITIQPDTVRVKLGSTIRWTNYDSEPANVVSESGPQKLASKSFGEGATFEVKLEKPGVIHYECTFYPTTMNGTIEVLS